MADEIPTTAKEPWKMGSVIGFCGGCGKPIVFGRPWTLDLDGRYQCSPPGKPCGWKSTATVATESEWTAMQERSARWRIGNDD